MFSSVVIRSVIVCNLFIVQSITNGVEKDKAERKPLINKNKIEDGSYHVTIDNIRYSISVKKYKVQASSTKDNRFPCEVFLVLNSELEKNCTIGLLFENYDQTYWDEIEKIQTMDKNNYFYLVRPEVKRNVFEVLLSPISSTLLGDKLLYKEKRKNCEYDNKTYGFIVFTLEQDGDKFWRKRLQNKP